MSDSQVTDFEWKDSIRGDEGGPKMVKYVDDICYGKAYDKEAAICGFCWLKGSCEATNKSQIKKAIMAKKKKSTKPREKPYKKTDKYRDW